MTERVLITGATGFVGQTVTARLKASGVKVRPVGRHEVGEIHRGTDWRQVLDGCSAVVHLAARVHVMTRDPSEGEAAFREVNLHGTANLVRQAAEAGLSRFVFMSSIKVLGESGELVSPEDAPRPYDAYAVSKTEAEAAIRDLAGPMDYAILRPPLVHGPGVKANFERLMRWIDAGRPLPFGLVRNKRSLIHVDNLADAVRHALTSAPGIFHPKDGEDLSTPDLIRVLAAGMGRPARLLPVPVPLLRGLGRITGTYPAIERLTGTFTSDGSMDGWTPPLPARAALTATAQAFATRY